VWIVAAALIKLWHGLCADPNGNYGLFFAYRAVHLATLVCPLAPMLPLLAAIYLWALGSIWRLRFNERVRPRLNPNCPIRSIEAGHGQYEARSLERVLRPGMETEKAIADAMSRFPLRPVFVWCFVIILVAWLLLNHGHPFELFERGEFGKLYEVLFCAVVVAIVASGLRTAQIWWKLKQLLLELNRSLVRFTFDRVKEPGWSPIWHQGTQESDWHYTVWSVEVINRIEHGKGWLNPSLDKCEPKASIALGDIRDLKNSLVKTRAVLPLHTSLEYLGLASKRKQVAVDFQELQQRIQNLQTCLARILVSVLDNLQSSWKDHPPDSKESGEQAKDKGERAAERQNLLEKYAALRYLAFIRAVLDHIRRLLLFLAISFSLLLISLNVYSFEPHRALIWSVTAIFAVVGFICVLVMMQAHRDPILSRITGTEANKLEFSFYVRIVSLGTIPLLTLLSTHFPSIGRTLISFLQPGLDALK